MSDEDASYAARALRTVLEEELARWERNGAVERGLVRERL
jgi:hypothetical protein